MSDTVNSLASTVLMSNEKQNKGATMKAATSGAEKMPLNGSIKTTMRNHTSISDNSSQEMAEDEGSLEFQKPGWWDLYKQLLRRYRIPLELAEEALERILFWMPHSESEDPNDPTAPKHQWREVLFGLLSLHRLSMYCASEETEGSTMGLENSYGMTIQTKEQPTISATRIRIYLSILHCLMPTLLEILPSNKNSRRNPSARQHSQSRVRLRLEQVKFGLRLYLLASYWTQQQWQQSKEGESWLDKLKGNAFNIGILQAGGMFDVVGQGSGLHSLEAERMGRRKAYMGRRTGLTIRLANGSGKILPPSLSSTTNIRASVSAEANGHESCLHNDSRQRKGHLIGILIGELLHILRPLYWASAEAYGGSETTSLSLPGIQQSSSSSLKMLKPWIETLLMDLVSLKLLWRHSTKNSGNPWTYDEWKRRKGRMLLYLLRGPIWSKMTHPVLEKGSAIWTKIPILGRLLDVFLWDWILYWKLPYIAEEG
ncbi:unnamed protein product [Cylindrotheca closterium]|uniref:Peroxisomal membrane protein PEX16 n=1 Tax=Cylindrotheca closterium TaxID=2856 RepID=A0AAD2JPE8_9STRA|nr:unnamed protein product [Cylindrotheca closterium]